MDLYLDAGALIPSSRLPLCHQLAISHQSFQRCGLDYCEADHQIDVWQLHRQDGVVAGLAEPIIISFPRYTRIGLKKRPTGV